MIEVNDCFEIGSSHMVCQDYTLSGEIQKEYGLFHYGIVCDGCSSSKDTDLGARFLALAARRILNNDDVLSKIFSIQADVLGKIIIDTVREYPEYDHLYKNASFDSTMLLFIANEGLYRIIFFGDGCAYVEDNGKRIFSLEYSENAPPYLSYKLDYDRTWGYVSKFGPSDKNVNVWNITDPHQPTLEANYSTKVGESPYFDITGEITNLKQISIFSDGIYSFKYKGSQVEPKIDFMERVETYSNYPIKKGEFLIRNFKYNSKQNEKNNREHYDDLSCASLVRY